MNNLGEGVRRKVLYNARNRIRIMVNENVLDQVRDDVCDRTMDEIFVVVPFIVFEYEIWYEIINQA